MTKKTVGRPRKTGGKAKYLTPMDIMKVERTQKGKKHELRNLTLFHYGLGTGMRLGELATLLVDDVWYQGKPLEEVVLVYQVTKQGRSRTVIVGETAQQWLIEWMKFKEETYKYDELRNGKNPKSLLFPSPRDADQPMSSSSLCHTRN